MPCRLDSHGHVGLQGRDIPCAAWVRRRLEGCYDIEDLRVLNLFGGNGFVTAQALKAGATVVHVDAGEEMLALARATAGEHNVEYVHENVMDYVEDLLRRQQRFDLIVLPVPPLGHGPKRQLWDREVDMPKLVRYLPRLVTDGCLGVWLSTDGGAITWKAEGLGQLLREVLPGCTIEPLHLGVASADGRVLPAGVAARWYDETEFLQTGGMPLTAAQLEERLDAHMVSLGAAEAPARELAEFPRARQDFVLHWVGVVGRSSHGMAFNFVAHVCRALRLMDEAGVEAWLLHCMDIYDTRGLYPAVSAFKDVDSFAREHQSRTKGLAFEEVAGVLEAFVHGLNGRRLKIACDEAALDGYRDPASAGLGQPVRDARGEFPALQGDGGAPVGADLVRHLAGDAARGAGALPGFRAGARPFPCPGNPAPGCPHPHRAAGRVPAAAALARAHRPAAGRCLAGRGRGAGTPGRHRARQPRAASRRHRRAAAAAGVLPGGAAPGRGGAGAPRAHRSGQPVLPARSAAHAEGARVPDRRGRGTRRGGRQRRGAPAVRVAQGAGGEMPNGFTFEIELDGRPLPPPDNVKGVMASILQDLGDIPEDYLYAAGDGAYFAGDAGERSVEDVWKGTYHEEGAFLYNEWDYERQHYRKNWAVLRELEVTPRYDSFVADTLVKYRGLAAALRRTFEALRGEDKLLKKQPYGENIDIDALVEAWADTRIGREMSDRLFTKMHKLERNIAVMFMVDMSGSTKGWINEAEREALVLLCESLETLGDRYAIYGFSGMTRKRCEVYRIKGFDDPYSEEVRARISGITPKDYTRMGVTIRHLTHLLNEVEARTRLLVTLSDGKPDDYDTYRGAYGIEDTRQALIEARRIGIHAFCITSPPRRGATCRICTGQ